MTELETMVHSQAGTIIALLVVVQALIAKHPRKASLAKTLRELSESDIAVVVAMRSPGKPIVDAVYRETMQAIVAAAEQPGTPAAGFPGFGTGSPL
jgi:hypothetical protein